MASMVVAGGMLAVLAVVPAQAIEKPKHVVSQRFQDFEIRDYASYLVAETRVNGSLEDSGNQAFRRLAGYIFGQNQTQQKVAMTAPVTQQGTRIAMTAPVSQQPDGSSYVVQFMMPSSWTLETLPRPLDAQVSLKNVPARRLAVVRYSGTWSEARYQKHLERLRLGLEREGLRMVGEPIWARYDPPWVPWFMRTNEIQVEVVRPSS